MNTATSPKAHTYYVDKSLLSTLRANDKVEYKEALDKAVTGLATEAYVNEAIAGIEIPEGGDVDLSNYYTKAEVDELIPEPTDLSNYYTKEEIDTTVAALEAADKGVSIIARRPMGDRTSYYLKEEDGAKLWANPSKYTIDYKGVEYRFYVKLIPDVYYVTEDFDKSNPDTKDVAFKAIKITTPSLDITELASIDLASKDYVDEALANAGGGDVDLSDYYTKEETTQAIQDALNAIGVAEGGAY